MSPARSDNSLDLTLLIGGVRAGKSARAVDMARASARRGVLFVATAEALDDEMRSRIAAHKAERPSDWHTLESPIELARDIDRRLTDDPRAAGTVIVDCLTLWVSNVLIALNDIDAAESTMVDRTAALIDTMRRHAHDGDEPRHWVVVSNEVGLGIVPSTPLGRRYRDALGRVNTLVAAAATEVTLMVAGVGLSLKPRTA
jgi:adenosylcobinamide kinase / adenosylcobinamide-phosphate guanylyltransferase